MVKVVCEGCGEGGGRFPISGRKRRGRRRRRTKAEGKAGGGKEEEEEEEEEEEGYKLWCEREGVVEGIVVGGGG